MMGGRRAAGTVKEEGDGAANIFKEETDQEKWGRRVECGKYPGSVEGFD